jgi:hypothetical protein
MPRGVLSRSRMKRGSSGVVGSAAIGAGALLLVGFQAPASFPRRVAIPLACSRGPSGQAHEVTISAPAHVLEGTRYQVRIEGVDSGKIEHPGLRYISDMRSDWPVPPGTAYVEGTARVVPGTGSDNVRAGARAVHERNAISLVLPSRVANGSSYTPPAFEFDLVVTSPGGASITQQLAGYSVSASVILLGDLRTTCEPVTRHFPVAVTQVESAP